MNHLENVRVLLSIVVPVFNTSPYLPRCLDSLLNQGLEPDEYEILVINDGSTDDSLAIAEEYAARHPNVIVHDQPNQGVATARNNAIEVAQGRYISFVDSDDYMSTDVLGSLVQTACAQSLQVLSFDLQRIGEGAPPPPKVSAEDLMQLSEVLTGVDFVGRYRYASESTCYLFDRGFLLDVGARFDVARIVEDVVFTATMLASAQRMAYLPIPLLWYVQRPGSIMNTVGFAHTEQLVADYERVVVRLDDLRKRHLADGSSTPEFDNRLRNRQQTFVFFLIARLIRSDVPVKPLLPDTLNTFRAIDMYPMDTFPGRDFQDFRSRQYSVLTAVFNRTYLLWPFIGAVRLAARIRRAGSGSPASLDLAR